MKKLVFLRKICVFVLMIFIWNLVCVNGNSKMLEEKNTIAVSSKFIKEKFKTIIIAVGEPEEIRFPKSSLISYIFLNPIYNLKNKFFSEEKTSSAIDYVLNQIENIFENVSAQDAEKVIIAYEPLWAIGTGKTPTKEDISEMHTSIRKNLELKYGKDIAEKIRIIYGGSVNKNNAEDFIKIENVDGFLVGSKSVDIEQVENIIEKIKKSYSNSDIRQPIFIGNFKAYELKNPKQYINRFKKIDFTLTNSKTKIEIFIAPSLVDLSKYDLLLNESA